MASEELTVGRLDLSSLKFPENLPDVEGSLNLLRSVSEFEYPHEENEYLQNLYESTYGIVPEEQRRNGVMSESMRIRLYQLFIAAERCMIERDGEPPCIKFEVLNRHIGSTLRLGTNISLSGELFYRDYDGRQPLNPMLTVYLVLSPLERTSEGSLKFAKTLPVISNNLSYRIHP